jgi:flagellar biosynthetic protein FliR
VEHLTLALLVFARAAGIMAAAPGFGLAEVPLKVRFAAAVVLVPVMAPLAQASALSATVGMEHLPLLALKEAVVGLAIGFAASLLFVGIGMAGRLVAAQIGFLHGATGPGTGASGLQLGGPIARFYYLLAVLTYFMIDGHHWLLAAVARAYAQLPVDSSLPSAAALGPVTDLAADMFVVAFQVGAPAIAALFLVDITVAAAGRTIPALSPFTVGLPLRCGVGLFAVAASAPLISAAVVAHARGMHAALVDAVMAL